MECLDLRIVEFKVERAYLPNSYQCGWAWPVISMDFKVKLYVKYKIYRWTYHDRMHIKVRASKTYPNYFYIGESDFCIIEDKNPSDSAVIKEKIIEKTIGYYDFGGSFKGEDYRKSGWRKWHIAFFTDSGGPVKAIDLSGYWDASTCKFTQFKVEGDIEQPPMPPKKEIRLIADRTKISEGETVNFTAYIYGAPRTTIRVCPYVEGRKGDCKDITINDSGLGILKFSITYPSYGSYRTKVCVVNMLTGKEILCSNEITINVKKKPEAKPKLIITANVNKTKANIGDTIKVYGYVKNVGNASSSSGYVIIYVDNKDVEKIPIIPLSPNKSVNYSKDIAINYEGKHIIKSCVITNDGLKVCSDPITVVIEKPKEAEQVTQPTKPSKPPEETKLEKPAEEKPTTVEKPTIPEEAKYGVLILLGLGALALAKKEKR